MMTATTSPFLHHLTRLTAVFAVALAVLSPAAHAAEEVNVYSYREPELIQPLLKAFSDKSGIKVNLIFAKDGLIERMQAEGKNSPADVLLANESSLLAQAQLAGVTQPLTSASINAAIPAELREEGGHWFALTRRARIVYASKERVKQAAITYEELADPKWKGKICVRSGQHNYNLALIASMIAHHGEARATEWLKGLKGNLARKPAGGDREAVRDVHAGLCDLAIGNTYYMAAMLKNPDQKAWTESVKLIFPNANDRGTHINISGMALAANAPHKDAAVKFMEYLASPEAQKVYAETLNEYPAVPGVAQSDLVKSWGELKPDPLPLSKINEFKKRASELVDEIHFDTGTE
jgi:iron(III) transport system substrate-binding protein